MKTKLIYLLALFLMYAGFVSEVTMAQTNPTTKLPDYLYKHYTGTINKTAKIFLNLTKSKNNLFGNYFYEKVGVNIHFSGAIKADSSFELIEVDDNGQPTGSFSGKLLSFDKIKGKWQTAKKDKSLDFELTENYLNSAEFSFLQHNDSLVITDPKFKTVTTFYADYLHPIKYADKIALDTLQNGIFMKYFGKKLDDPQKQLVAMKADFFKSYNDAIKDMPLNEENASMMNWDSSMSGDVIFNDFGVVSYELNTYSFQGGAHGNGMNNFYVYDLKSKKRLTKKDIFAKDTDKKIAAILLAKVMKKTGIKTPQGLTDEGYTVEAIVPNENFWVTRKGITFFYNAYEIAPYAMGPSSYYVSFKELKLLLKADSPIKNFFD